MVPTLYPANLGTIKLTIMKYTYFSTAVILLLFFSISLKAQNAGDRKQINNIISDISEGWKKKDVDLTVAHYAEDVDWTNAFGDRMQSKNDLKALLTRIYSMDFVMKGNSKKQYDDINFLSPEIAVVRSKTIVKGQEWGDGTKMKDRNNHHLMVFQKSEGVWKIHSHLISQAWTKK